MFKSFLKWLDQALSRARRCHNKETMVEWLGDWIADDLGEAELIFLHQQGELETFVGKMIPHIIPEYHIQKGGGSEVIIVNDISFLAKQVALYLERSLLV
ncbi:MAG: hypothetical protein QG609_340 [Patescibacteria group bacterium]|nr:hypothetical protein [Patescibacteria group bacterium]